MKSLFSWRFWLIAVTIVFGILYALPNLYGYQPAIQISQSPNQSLASLSSKPLPSTSAIAEILAANQVPFDSISGDENAILVEFLDISNQLAAQRLLNQSLEGVITSIRLEPQHPNWLDQINALPMYLGLDLRGGVYFLMEVDIQSTLNDILNRYFNDFSRSLSNQGFNSSQSFDSTNQQISIDLEESEVNSALSWLTDNYPELSFSRNQENQSSNQIIAGVSDNRVQEIVDFSIRQNMSTLRNRIDELGVAEPIVQRQGRNHIVVQLPGVQDTKRAKEILGATASLEFRAVNETDSVYTAVQRGRAPVGNELLLMRDNQSPILLRNQVIVSGDQVVDAASSISQQNNEPVVSITLDSVGGDRMLEFTQKNLGKRMGVVYIEFFRNPQGELVGSKSVISDAVVQGVFSNRFQISGLESPEEARDLALLLRSGALAAPMDIVEERTMGPSLGQKNIQQGFLSLLAGLFLVLLFMPFRYKIFGLFADICLILNLVFICAILSLFQATLTLPGIAGVVLTMGMAVDANVLIFERIREQLRLGLSNYESIKQGFAQAFQTIFDANITTLIAAVVLFVFGTGPIKGFALTLSIGIVTSMFSAIFIGRFLIDAFYQNSASKTDKPLAIQ